MAADAPGGRDELKATRRASGAGRTLAASLPRLILEVAQDRRDRDPRPARPPALGLRREFLAVPPLRLRRGGPPHRLAALGARRQSLCARAGVGGRAYHLAVAGPLAVDGVLVAARAREQARPRAHHRLRARRNPGRGRRARRPARPDAADRQPRRDRPHGGGDHPRSDRAREPAGRLRAGVAVGDRGAVRPVEPDRGNPRDPDAAFHQRLAGPSRADRRSGGGDLPLFRPHRVHRAGRLRRDHRRPRRELARRLRGAAEAPPRRNPRRDRPARLELHHPPHRPPGQRAADGAACPHRRRQRRRHHQPPAARHGACEAA